jgi:hypothetical protein
VPNARIGTPLTRDFQRQKLRPVLALYQHGYDFVSGQAFGSYLKLFYCENFLLLIIFKMSLACTPASLAVLLRTPSTLNPPFFESQRFALFSVQRLRFQTD